MNDRRLVFTGPGRVEVQGFEAGHPGPGQVGLHSLVSAISAGTEALLWHGLWPGDLALDGSWSPEAGSAAYPVSYGYALVGLVGEVGPGVDPSCVGRLAFAFAPHQSRSIVDLERLVLLPPGLSAEDAVTLASMETALSVAQDAAPVVGEVVGVWGLGTIGVLTAALLSPSFDVRAWDKEPHRRQCATDFGVSVSRPRAGECDVAVELTGHPEALVDALAATRFSGRVITGSWYGAQPVSLDLGGEFHRSRIQIVSSQVSTLSPGLSGRWTKRRRLEQTVSLLQRFSASRLITHRFGLDQAAEAYAQACDRPGAGLQVVFTYEPV